MTLAANSGNNSGRRGNLQNLKPFRPGQSGNPGGRPRRGKFANVLESLAEELVPDDPKRRTRKKLLADQIFLQAAKGNVQAFAEIVNRVEGKAVQRVDLEQNMLEDDPKNTLRAFIGNLRGAKDNSA